MSGATGADVVAAGGVLWRPGPGGAPELAVVHRPRYDDWSLPKGKLDRGESAAEAAVRELAEETGYTARLRHRLGEVRYPVPEGRKVVHWWSARAVSGAFVPSREVDELRWILPDEAAKLLIYPHDRQVLERFRVRAEATTSVLLVRHAKAGDRDGWHGDDAQRPLTARGRAQLPRLTRLLALFGPSRVHSATPLRCTQTVAPVADALGTTVLPEPMLGEHFYTHDPDAALARLRSLARLPGVTVLCSQGGVIPHVVRALAGVPAPEASKASVWALGFDGDRVVTADHYPPTR